MTAKKDEKYCYEDVEFKEELDPAVKVELEILNQSGTDINRLEKEIDEARAKYQTTFVESSQLLEQLKKKFGSSIKRARPYYELQEAAREAQAEALRSARKFQASNSIYLVAKETISLAELRLMDDKAACLSPAWQEMLNHALLRFTEAEKEKSISEQEHLERAAVFADMETKLHLLEKKHKRFIVKARPYFESKKELDVKLQQVKQSVEDLQQAFKAAKQQYSGALKRLEKISDSIHEQRRQKFILMFPREPGVGAEDISEITETEARFPTLSTSDGIEDQDSLYCDSDDNAFGKSSDDDDDEGYLDINNESIFRARVLTTSLDEEDTSFMRLKYGRKKRENKPVKRTQSLPLYPGRRITKSDDINSPQSSFGSNEYIKSLLEKPLVPLSDRSENYAPDGDSLSGEKSITYDMNMSNDDINCGIMPSLPFSNFDTFMTKSSKDIFQQSIFESSKKMLDSFENLNHTGINSTHEDISTHLPKVPAEELDGNTTDTIFIKDIQHAGYPEVSDKISTSAQPQTNESCQKSV